MVKSIEALDALQLAQECLQFVEVSESATFGPKVRFPEDWGWLRMGFLGLGVEGLKGLRFRV